MRKIIGLAGTFASGKDTVADYLVSRYGYNHVSTGDIVRTEALKRGLTTHRDDLFNVANDMRNVYGADILVSSVLKANTAKRVVISGIRNAKEVEALKAANGYFVFVDAPIESRYERAKSRGRLEDKTDLAGFKAQEERELNNSAEHTQHIEAIKGMADITLINDADLDTLKRKSDEIVED